MENIEINGQTLKMSGIGKNILIGTFDSFEITLNKIFKEELELCNKVLKGEIDRSELDPIDLAQRVIEKYNILEQKATAPKSPLYTHEELYTTDIYSLVDYDHDRLEKIRLILPYMEDEEIAYYVDVICPVKLEKGEIQFEEDISDQTLKNMNTCAWGNLAHVSIHGKGELKKYAKDKLDRAKYLCKPKFLIPGEE